VVNRPLPHLLDPTTGGESEVETRVVGKSLGDRVRALRLPDDAEMRSRGAGRRIVSLVLLAALLAGGVGAGYYAVKQGWLNKLTGKKYSEATDVSSGNSSTSAKSPPLPSSSATSSSSPAGSIPVASSGNVTLEAKGYIIPAHQILVSPMVSGRILALSIEEGRRVEKGAVLAELETTEYEADVAGAEATRDVAKSSLEELNRGNRPEEIAAAKAELAEAEVQREMLLSDWKRKKQLRENRVLSENEYEQAESQFKAMDRRVERLRNNHKLMVEGPRVERIAVAKAQVHQAEAELKRAQWRFDNCTIRAPISGTILKKNAEEGNIVNPIAFNGSFSLCEMADLSDLEVDLSIQERDIARVKKGQRCKVRAEADRRSGQRRRASAREAHGAGR
jgi:HlyD family secretion protein